MERIKTLLADQEAIKQEILQHKCANEKLQRELNEKVLAAAIAAGRSDQVNHTNQEKFESEKARNATLEEKLSKY